MPRLIDADALKEGIAELKRSPWYNNETVPSLHAGIKEAIEVVELLCIDKAPTVDAEPVKRGKWKCTYSPYGFLLEQTCSECGLTFEESSGVDYNYCPNCGARMDND